MEAALDLRRHCAFDLDGPKFSARKREKKVHLGSVGGSIIARLGSVRRCRNQSLHDKALPGLTDDRMTEQSFLVANAKQRVRDAAIAHIDLGRLDQPFANIPMPGRQSPDKQQVNQKIKITGNGFAIDGQTTRQGSGIQNLSLIVRQHGPESPQRLSRYARAKLRNIALQIGSNKIPSPEQTGVVGFRQKASRKSTPNPERLKRGRIDLQGIEGAEFEIGDTPGQALAGLLEQV